MVLDIEAHPKILIIIGRPLMETAKMWVDIDKCQAKVIIKDGEVCFKVIGVMQH